MRRGISHQGKGEQREGPVGISIAEDPPSHEEHRQEGPYSIHLQESHAIEGRTIVVIELNESDEATPVTIFAQRPDGRCYKLTLPEAQNARIQLLVDQDSAILAALRDPNATVILR